MSDVVREYYDSQADQEWSRLDSPLCRLEFCSTMRLIEKYFPPAGLVCDIGGGPGRYTLELLRRNYSVTLVDLSSELLSRAKLELEKAGLVADGLVQSDAADLRGLPNEYCQAALLLGPLYHIVDPMRRRQALSELRRVLRPNGVAIVAYLNSWGILRCGIGDFPERYSDTGFLRSLLDQKTFQKELSGFTECHWSTPPTAISELKSEGFEILSHAGAEGFVGGMRPMIERIVMDRPDILSALEVMAAETCELPQYKDATEHLCVVIRKLA